MTIARKNTVNLLPHNGYVVSFFFSIFLDLDFLKFDFQFHSVWII